MDKIITYDSIASFNNEFGIETPHPLIYIEEMEKTKPVTMEEKYIFNFYHIYLIDANCGSIKYGKNYYDYQDGTLLFLSPGQVVSVENQPTDLSKGWVLMFHPDLLHGTQLGRNMKKYTFFSYNTNEALHLSEQERAVVINCFRNIKMELGHIMDNNSKDLIVSNIELFLNYGKRFYERQFITQIHSTGGDILSHFENILNDYFQSGQPSENGIPTVKYCADQMHLSVNYLSDLLRKETGKGAMEHIHLKLMEIAKERLFDKSKSISEIAYELGFEYPQHFSRIFKNKVGVSPNEYRNAIK